LVWDEGGLERESENSRIDHAVLKTCGSVPIRRGTDR